MTDQPAAIPFDASSTARQVLDGVDLAGRRAVVTGGASGIGLETSVALAGAGADVTLAVRNPEGARAAAAEIDRRSGGPAVSVRPLDLADPASVRAFVDAWPGSLHILVNNAGVMAPPDLQRNPQGHEIQFATNHLGHFALAVGLRGALAASGDARVVSVSSVGHVAAGIDFDDLDFQRRPYDRWVAYGQSKTANILFAVEGARRWADDGITVNALNPGRIPSTNLMRHLAGSGVESTTDSEGVSFKSPEQGAATSALLAASPLVALTSGRYFEDCQIAGSHQAGIRRGVMPYAIDAALGERLWRVSLELTS